jgi:hypothetical protein
LTERAAPVSSEARASGAEAMMAHPKLLIAKMKLTTLHGEQIWF